MSDRLPFPIPDGWFGVVWSGDLAADEPNPIRCFGLGITRVCGLTDMAFLAMNTPIAAYRERAAQLDSPSAPA